MPTILHLGFGNFHRAHQAWYTQIANDLGGAQWRIIGVSMRRADLRDALAPADFSYTLALNGSEGATFTKMNVHERLLVAAQDPQTVINAIADPDVQIVTLTITEKGYGLNADGSLNLRDDAIQRDLAGGQQPSHAIGLLSRGLSQRAKTGRPITVISCDNLSDNGRILQAAVETFARAAEMNIQIYLEDKVRFPNTMVDRITPATTPDLTMMVAKATGTAEPSPVVTEAYSEWVIEDDFAASRPDWDKVGVQITADVGPFEARKLRMLNAAHSLLAYAGLLRGHRFVHEAISDATLLELVNGLWDEAQSTLPAESAAGVPEYRRNLLARFSVPDMQHELRQIAMDGSLKLSLRVMPSLRDRRASGQDAHFCLIALSSWIACLMRGEQPEDPIADDLADIVKRSKDATQLRKFVADRLGWSDDLGGVEDRLDEAVANWL